MIEGGSRVVGELPDQQTPSRRRGVEQAKAEDVFLRGARLVLADDSVRLLFEPSLDIGFQRFKAIIRPVQLQTEAV